MNKTQMKRLVITLSFVLFLTIVSCSTDNNASTDQANTPGTAKVDVEDKIVFYKGKLIELSGIEGEMLESEMNYYHSNDVINLSNFYDEYDREELPKREKPDYTNSGVNPENLIITADTLNSFTSILDSCEDFKDNEFFNTTYDLSEYKIKMFTNGDELYIESYRYNLEDTSSIRVDIMHFNLIEDKVHFEYLRENRSSDSHRLYYDSFSETGDVINIALDVKTSKLTNYQLYDRSINKSVYLNYFAGALSMNFKNHSDDGEASYSIVIDDQDNISRYNLQYRESIQDFWYTKDGENIHLFWNLFLVDGWNKCRVYNNNDDKIYKDDAELLEDFEINIDTKSGFANARITVIESAFTESFMNLSDFGLFFDFVTYSQLQMDIDYIDTNFISIIEGYGLTTDMGNNYNVLYDTIPFVPDDSIIQIIELEEITHQ